MTPMSGWNWLRTRLGLARAVAPVIVVAGLSTGCYANNAYPVPGGQYWVDIFPEMHYQQWFRAQEPYRLYPPEGAVPTQGSEVALDASSAARLTNPVARTANNARGDQLYTINCAVCHGDKADGAGKAAVFIQAYNGKAPANLTQASTKARSDGDLFYILTNGLNYAPDGAINGMPAFGKLLTVEDRWNLVNKIRRLQGS